VPFIEVDADTICKHPDETFYIGFDFGDDLGSSEFIDQTKTEIKTYRIADMTEVTGIVNPDEIYYDGDIVIFRIQGGEQGKQYFIEVKVTTNEGNVFVSKRRLKVI